MDQDLLRKAQAAANRTGKKLNELLEEAVTQYLAHLEPASHVDMVSRTWGSYRIDGRSLKRLMDEDIYDAR